MELPPSLGLGTINIARLVEGLIYYHIMCPEFRYEDGKVLGTQPHPTQPMGWLPLIVFQVLILLKASLICYSNPHTH